VIFCSGELVLFKSEDIQSQSLSCWDFLLVYLINTFVFADFQQHLLNVDAQDMF